MSGIDNTDKITGSMMTRHNGFVLPDGRKVFIIWGLIAFPPSVAPEGERHFVVTGKDHGPLEMISLFIHKLCRLPSDKVMYGETPDGTVREPIWRF